MPSQRFAFILLALAAVSATGVLSSCEQRRDRSTRAEHVLCSGCNVVLISFDTVRADHLPVYGYARPTSPNIDAFARNAVVFEHAISQTAWTLPAHASIMTGLYPARLGLERYPAVRIIPEGATMLAEVFRRAGYATGGFTGGGFVSGHWGFDRGFETYTTGGRRFQNNLKEATAWLELHRKRRFFLFLHGYNAHRPYYSARADRQALGVANSAVADKRGFCGDDREQPSPEKLANIVGNYDAAIHDGDRQIGRFLGELNRLGLADKTVVMLTSDHGEEFFEHGNCDHVRSVYQEIVHVPLLVRVPGFKPALPRVTELVPATVSVARTLLELVGIHNAMPGTSLVPTMLGEHSGFRAVFSHTSSIQGKRGSRGETYAITTSKDKLIAYPEEGVDEGYDLAVDPTESHVLPEGDPVYTLRPTLRAWRTSIVPLPRSHEGEAGGEETPVLPKDVEESLRSLGYME